MKKRCFVIMPIRHSGSAEYKHFRALYQNVILPAVSQLGYETTRADDYQKSGNITRDIVSPLAHADLVIADLTDLNPNVFYELGVRHALRGTGTIMILDERETKIPFDLTVYRVIKFRSDLEGVGVLASELKTFVEQLESGTIDVRDNPVHDLLPSLPVNVLASADGSQEGELRREVQTLRKQLSAFEERYGEMRGTPREDPLNLVRLALLEAESGNLPSVLVENAQSLARAGDAKAFLEHVVRILELKTTLPSTKAMMRLANAATLLDLTSVREAILDHACALYSTNRELRLARLQNFAHSEDSARRATARDEFFNDLGLANIDGEIKLTRPLIGIDFMSFGLMMDTYHRDQLHKQAFELSEMLYQNYPDNSRVVRNYARAHERVGEIDKALDFYIEAALSPDSDDTASIWLGNELHNRERHVDAAEAYTLACLYDPDDALCFAHLAEELSYAILERDRRGSSSPRELPSELHSPPLVEGIIIAAISCGQVGVDAGERLRSAARRVESDLDGIVSAIQAGEAMTRKERVDSVRKIRESLASELTTVKRTVSENA